MKIDLLYGEAGVKIDVPERARVLEGQDPPALADPEAALREALAHPSGTPPLAEVARGRRSACVVISDVTRPVPNPLLLPPLLTTLERAGVPRGEITLLVATGMHRPNLGSELERLVGGEVARTWRVVNHDCRAAADLREVARLEGAPVALNRHYLEAELKILTGLVEPHFYAGYSGGRKSLVPGIASLETMRFMHGWAMVDHPAVRPGVLDGNPFHEYALRVADTVGVDFLVNVVLNQRRQPVRWLAGHHDRAHREGCALVETAALARVDEPQDLVITSGGGAPLDATFYQLAKGLEGAGAILRPGGSVLILGRCGEGLGSAPFREILARGFDPAGFAAHYARPENFTTDQWCAQNIYRVLARAGRVHVFAEGLAGADLARLGAIRVEDLQGTVDALTADHDRVALVPHGPYTLTRLA